MDNTILRDMLYISGCGAAGNNIDRKIHCEDWHRMLGHLDGCKLYGFAMYALIKDGNSNTDCPLDMIDSGRQRIRNMALKQMSGYANLFSFVDELKEAGFSPLLLKGILLADCYKQPYLRTSNDVDFYIDESDEKALCSFLKKKGFFIEERARYEHHFQAKHDKYGFFEFHVQLFADKVANVWEGQSGLSIFKKRTGDISSYYVDRHSIESLDSTEHFLFVVLHFVKHFLSMEAEIRMVMDICLYAVKYDDLIDWSYFISVIEKLGYRKLLDNVFEIGNELMGIKTSWPPLTCPDENTLCEIADILCSPMKNMEITAKFNDIFWTKESNQISGGFGSRVKFLWIGSVPFFKKYVRQYSLKETLKMGSMKILRILFRGGMESDNGQYDSDIADRLKVFKQLGLTK